jgi:hypothetical protein
LAIFHRNAPRLILAEQLGGRSPNPARYVAGSKGKPMTEPTEQQREQWRLAELAAQERDRRQAILDYWAEVKRGAAEAEREYQRQLRKSLDPFNYGHWRGE